MLPRSWRCAAGVHGSGLAGGGIWAEAAALAEAPTGLATGVAASAAPWDCCVRCVAIRLLPAAAAAAAAAACVPVRSVAGSWVATCVTNCVAAGACCCGGCARAAAAGR